MPLLKLWKSLFGREDPQPAPVTPAAEPSRSIPASESVSTKKSVPAQKFRRAKPASRRILGIGRSGPHAVLCKQLRRLQPQTVLEISVGDGSRAVALLETLRSSTHEVRYVAIDEFELGTAEVTLKEFHQMLRREQVRSAKLFPEPIDRGLRRVATTLGAVDLIIIAAPTSQWRNADLLPLIARISHPQTVVFYQEEEHWHRLEPEPVVLRRAA